MAEITHNITGLFIQVQNEQGQEFDVNINTSEDAIAILEFIQSRNNGSLNLTEVVELKTNET